ncbi:ABC transporter substrate-binding protein [Muricoccus radiodurans]|uniref:ABC transporter substrate-binding protein n=1 Tax=Muricoccus radiodurans TaxID=2231721 RepID=UPI003CF3147B
MPKLPRRALFLAALAAPTVLRAQDRTRVRLVLNFAVDGSTAPFYYGVERGYFRDAGLDVQVDPSNGSGDAISRVASGTYQFGVGDISTLTEFVVRQPDSAPRAVMVLQNRSPQAVISLKSAGISTPKDLEGKVIGNGAADAASRMFPAFLRLNNVDESRVTRRQVTAQLRDQMLLTRQVAGVTGFDYTTFFNIKANGTRLEDVNFLYYADHGLDSYGNSVLAGQGIIRDNPDAVRRFVAAAARAWRESIADPRAPAAVIRAQSSLIDPVLEADRLDWLGNRQLLTPATRARGLGDVEAARLADTIRTVASGFGLVRTPAPDEVYDGRFLPESAARMPLR